MATEDVAKIASLLLAAGAAAAQWTELPAALQHLLDAMIQAVDHERSVLYRFDERLEHMEVLASVGSPTPPVGAQIPLGALTTRARTLVAHGSTAFIDFEALPADQRGIGERYGVRTLLAVPVAYGGRVLGAIVLDTPGERTEFSATEIELAEAFAFQAATSIETARLFEEQKLRASRLEALNEMLAIATSSLEPAEVATRVLDHIVQRLGVDLVTLWRFDADAQRLYPVSDVGMGHRFQADFAGGVGLEDDYAIALAFRTRQPVVLDRGRVGQVPSAVQQAYERLGLSVGALLVLPVPGRTGTLGSITLAWTEPRWLDEDDVAFFSSAISALAIAAANAELYDEVRQRRERIEALHRVTEMAVSSLDAAETSRRTLRHLVDELGVDMSALWVRDGDSLRVLATADYPDTFIARVSPMPLDGPLDPPKVLRTGEPVVVPDVAGASQAVRDLFESTGVRCGSFAIVPVQAHSETFGTLHLAWREPRRIPPADVEFFRAVANEVGIALENARLYEAQVEAKRDARRELSTTSMLLKAANSFAELTSIEAVVFALGEMAVQASEHSRATVHLWDERRQELRVHASSGLDPHPLGLIMRWDEFSPATQQVLMKRKCAVVDITAQPSGEHDHADKYGISYVLVLPIVRGERLIGIMAIDDSDAWREFTEREIEVFEAIAAQAAIALENARLFEGEHRVAETLQHALLEVPEHVRGIVHAELYRSATETAQVGGDFYDLFEITPERIGIVIGDVSGKGLEAASMTATVRDTLRVCAMDGLSPAATVNKTNDLLCRFTPIEVFVTLFFGTLDTRTGALRYVAAGHPAPLVLHGDGQVDALVAASPIVGAFRGTSYVEHSATFRDDDVLVLFTDGLVEARRERELYGQERAAEALGRHFARAGASLEGLLQALSEDARAFAGGNLRDDMALLAVRRNMDIE